MAATLAWKVDENILEPCLDRVAQITDELTKKAPKGALCLTDAASKVVSFCSRIPSGVLNAIKHG